MKNFLALFAVMVLVACSVVIPQMKLSGTYQLGPDASFTVYIKEAVPLSADANVSKEDAQVDDSADAGVPTLPIYDGGNEAQLPDASYGLVGDPCCESASELGQQPDYPTPVLPLPEDRELFVEPTFGVPVVSVPLGWRHEYSQLQAFNFDSSLLLLRNLVEDRYAIFDRATLVEVHPVVGQYPRWLPGTNTVVTLTDGLKILYMNATTGQVAEYMDLSALCRRAGPEGFEEISRDGRWLGIYCRDPANQLLFVDLKNKTVGWHASVPSLCSVGAVDWMGPAPVGDQAVVQWRGDGFAPCRGFWLYDIETGAPVRNVRTSKAHADQGVSENGKAFLLSYVNQHPNHNGVPAVVQHWYDGSDSTVLRMVPWQRTEHFSCQGPMGAPCVIWSRSRPDAYGGPMHREEVWLQHFDGRVTRLAHHRSVGCSGALNYWTLPMPSVSSDGRFAIFASDWGTSCTSIRAYLVRIR